MWSGDTVGMLPPRRVLVQTRVGPNPSLAIDRDLAAVAHAPAAVPPAVGVRTAFSGAVRTAFPPTKMATIVVPDGYDAYMVPRGHGYAPGASDGQVYAGSGFEFQPPPQPPQPQAQQHQTMVYASVPMQYDPRVVPFAMGSPQGITYVYHANGPQDILPAHAQEVTCPPAYASAAGHVMTAQGPAGAFGPGGGLKGW
jgi:hypothetical protein